MLASSTLVNRRAINYCRDGVCQMLFSKAIYINVGWMYNAILVLLVRFLGILSKLLMIFIITM